jgi:ADP-ribose pyrophosphatase
MKEQLAPGQEVPYRGKIFEIVQTTQPDGRVFEKAVRAPGVRLIIANKPSRKLLLTREFRSELNDWDYRLPGGKVFDTLDEYGAFRESGADIAEAVHRKSVGEGSEEAGVTIKSTQHFKTSTLGATVEWDLWVEEATDWETSEAGQKLEVGEQIEADNWFNYDEVKQMILGGHMQEERVALILLQWLDRQD